MPDKTDANGVPTRDGIYGWVDEQAYHADRGSLSVSGAKLLLPPSCPAKFREQQDNPPPPKRVYDFGSFFHLIVLGKGVDIVEIDADNYRTKAAREQRDAAHAAGKVPVLVGAGANDDFAAEIGKAQAMADSVLAHPIAGELLTHPRNLVEQAIYATDPKTGVRLRGRTDCLHFADDGRVTIIDIKTSATVNPAEMVRKWFNLNYFMQDAWYRDLLVAAGLADDPDFVFVGVEKEPPYLVTVARYTELAREEGRRRNRRAIDLYAECMETGVWPGYTTEIVPLGLPGWVEREVQTEADQQLASELIAELEGIYQ